ncbi:MAG: D-glycero-beta-D-manno-heptose-7-phosphate kinase [Pseudobdellovibrionaceae bacterium]
MSKLITIPVTSTEKKKLLSHLPQLNGRRIMIIGDVGVDEYVMGEVRRISPEAPVPVLDVESQDVRLGLSANVAQNVRSLGGEPILVSLVGADSGREILNEMLKKANVSSDYLVVDAQRPTTRKARIMAKHHHLVRVDYELRKFISAEIENQVITMVKAQIPHVDAVVIEDYAKGMITQSLVQKVVQVAHAAGKKVMVDPHRLNAAAFYSGVDLIKPNFDEAVVLSGLNYDELRDHPDKVLEVGHAVLAKTQAKELVMTRGKDGMTIFSDGKIFQVPTFARQVFDVTGAGDTVIAALSLGLVSGLSLPEACMMANFAAGVVVGQIGCVPCTQEELSRYIQETEKP